MGVNPHAPFVRATDWLALLACAALILIGPAMALQEFAKSQEQAARQSITGTLPPPDPAFRAAWRFPITVLVIAIGVLGSWTAARALLDPDVRFVCARLLGLLLGGLALLYATYYIDGAAMTDAPYVLRGATVVWIYPLAGLVIGGSVHRLADLDEHFGRAARRTREGDVAFRI